MIIYNHKHLFLKQYKVNNVIDSRNPTYKFKKNKQDFLTNFKTVETNDYTKYLADLAATFRIIVRHAD